MDVARRELALECNYKLEAEWGERFRRQLSDDPVLYVPEVITELSTERVLTTELVSGISLEKVSALDQETRNFVCMFCLHIKLIMYILKNANGFPVLLLRLKKLQIIYSSQFVLSLQLRIGNVHYFMKL